MPLIGFFSLYARLNLVPRTQPLRLEVREVDVALFGFALLPHHVDFVAGLEPGLALVIENFGDRRHAFGFRPDIDHYVGRGQFDHAAFNHMVFANCFFGFVLEVMQGGGKIVVTEELSAAAFSSASVAAWISGTSCVAGVRGGSGSAGEGCTCSGASITAEPPVCVSCAVVMVSIAGFKVAGGAVIEQIHSLGVDASCATRAGRGVADCWRGL